jgi:aminoglycoside phosphotransferase (APT) family kinase protein
VVSVPELAAAPGRRTVVRYRVRGLAGAAESVIVGKAFVERRRADLLHRQLRLLAPLGPEPLGHVPDLGLVLYRHREGTPLDRVTDPTTRHDGVRAAARWLAALHSAPVVLPRALQLEDEADTARTWAALVASAHPDLAGPALAIADGWLPRELSSPVPRVPLHKDFHPGHVLVGDRVHVVDLDEARQGDPAFDLAHFRAYAALLGDGTSLATAFLQEYAAVTGWEDQGNLRSFEAYAWLKIARQWVTGAALFRGAPSARRREGTEQALAKGVACLPA